MKYWEHKNGMLSSVNKYDTETIEGLKKLDEYLARKKKLELRKKKIEQLLDF